MSRRGDGTYGSPRLYRTLRQAGYRVRRRRVERLMRTQGWRARVVRVYRPKAGTHRWFAQHPNHVRRARATAPNHIWVGDVTYLSVEGRWWYCAVIVDQCSRRVLAWRLAPVRASRVTSTVLAAALRRRRPAPGSSSTLAGAVSSWGRARASTCGRLPPGRA
jgi:transposase InsO family protein